MARTQAEASAMKQQATRWLSYFIRRAANDVTATIPDSIATYIAAILQGPCLNAAFDQLQPLARSGNRSAMLLMAAMPSPAAPPGGE